MGRVPRGPVVGHIMDTGGVVSMVLSVGAAASSVYLWVLQRQRETPALRLHFGRRRPRWAGTFLAPGERHCHHLEVEFVVANLSALPDVLTGVRLRVRSREGGWLPAVREGARGTVDPTRLPVSLPPRSTARLWLLLGIDVDQGVEPQACLAAPLQVEAVLAGLGGREHRVRLTAPADHTF